VKEDIVMIIFEMGVGRTLTRFPNLNDLEQGSWCHLMGPYYDWNLHDPDKMLDSF